MSDDGPGVTAASRELAFAAGERLGATSRGDGMGLASCRSLVESFGGRIWLRDAEGGGLAVHVLLPERTDR